METARVSYQKSKDRRFKYRYRAKEIANALNLHHETIHRLRKSIDTDELYDILLCSKLNVHQKKRYVYGLEISEEIQNNIWEKFTKKWISYLI